MQGEAKISVERVGAVIDSVFSEGSPVVYESRSDPEEDLRSFDSALALEAEIEMRLSDEKRFVAYSIYYPEAKGLLRKNRKELILEKNDGKRFHFSTDGWGVIQLQVTPSDADVTCRVAVNSAKRAPVWFNTCPDHGDPRLWDWKIVEKHARRIIRALKKPNSECSASQRNAIAEHISVSESRSSRGLAR